MTIEAGRQLLHYRLIEQIGEGGMGVVWRATDTTLGRDVAIKILPAAVADDADRLARFEREARLLASLSHPNIAGIYGLHHSDASSGQPVHFLAMELVEGEDLARRLERAPLAIDDALDVVGQVSTALAAAHQSGVIHRDLKPANIQLTPDGTVKVLDFGLAKALAVDTPSGSGPSMSPTLTSAGTVAGMILGTAAYMSPEQAKAKSVDQRADVWALGCVLYETLTGRKPFRGETIAETLAAVLKDEPDESALPAEAAPLVPVLRRCLQKHPAERLTSPADVRLLLADAMATAARPESSPPPEVAAHKPAWVLPALALTAIAAVAFAALWLQARGGDTAALEAGYRFEQQTFYGGAERDPTLSPDGSFLAYSGESDAGERRDIFLERVGGRNPINLTKDLAPFNDGPAFSADGRWIAFSSAAAAGVGGIHVMGATGESVRRLTDDGFDPAWSPDGTQLAFVAEQVDDPFSRNRLSSLYVVNVAGGERRELYSGDAMQPAWSPNGTRIAYWTAYTSSRGQRDIGTIRADGTEPVLVTDDPHTDWNPVWSPDGTALYFVSDRGGSMNLWRVPIDESTGRTLGEPEPIGAPALWAGPVSVAAGGLIAFASQENRSHIFRLPLDPEALVITGPPQPVTRGSLRVNGMNASPDGETVVFSSAEREDLYLVRSDGSGLRKLTDDAHFDRGPSWSPDGERIFFYSTRGGNFDIWSIRRDGSDARRLSDLGDDSLWFPVASPDGRMLAVFDAGGAWLFDADRDTPFTLADGRKLPPVGESELPFWGLQWSPDGRLLCGISLGDFQHYVMWDVEKEAYRTFDTPDGKPGGLFGWLPDGRGLALAGSELIALDVSSGATTTVANADGLAASVFAGTVVVVQDGRSIYYADQSQEADIWIGHPRPTARALALRDAAGARR